VETQTVGDDILSGSMELHALAGTHHLLEERIDPTKLQVKVINEARMQYEVGFQKPADTIRYGSIGLQRLLFRLVHGDCRSAKKTEERDGRYLPQ